MRRQALSTRRLGLAIAAVVVAFDQATKAWVAAALEPGDPWELIPGFFQIAHIRNPGAAFGLLRGAGSYIALGAVVAVVVIALVIRKVERPFDAVALGLVLGGAVGNLLDRIFRGDGLLDGKVVDFLDFSFFPAFNVADSAITVGAALALLEVVSARSAQKSPAT